MKTYQTFFTLFAGVMLSVAAGAQSTAQEGLNKLKGNLNNSKSNLDDYKKNLKIVEGNVSEASKAKTLVEEQKLQVTKALDENNQRVSLLKNQLSVSRLLFNTRCSPRLESQGSRIT